jgi:WD40 repeat protein
VLFIFLRKIIMQALQPYSKNIPHPNGTRPFYIFDIKTQLDELKKDAKLTAIDLSWHRQHDAKFQPKEDKTLTGHTGSVCALAVLPDGRIVSGSSDNTIKVWNRNLNTVDAELKGHTNTVFALAVLPDGRIVSGSSDNTIKVWNRNLNTVDAELKGHTNTVFALAVLPDGRIVSGSMDHTIKVWNRNLKTVDAELTEHTSSVCALAVLPDGRIVSGSSDRTIKVWNRNLKTMDTELKGHTNAVYALEVLPNGRIVSGSMDHTIKVWNRDLNTVDAELKGHNDYVRALTILSDRHLLSGSGGSIIFGSLNNNIKLWDIAMKTCLANLNGHNEYIMAFKLLPDGRLVSAAGDKTIKVWDVGLRALRLQELQPLFTALADYPNAKQLNLQHSALTDQNVPALIVLLQKSHLTYLDIRQTQITETGAQQLLEACQQLDRAITIRVDHHHENMWSFLSMSEKNTKKEMQTKLDVQAKRLSDADKQIQMLQAQSAQQQRTLSQLAAYPENLHRLVQLGDVATLKGLLLENAPAAVAKDSKSDSKADSKYAPVSAAPKESVPLEKQEKVMKDNKPLKNSNGSAALDQKYAIPTSIATASPTVIPRDLHGMSFIPLADAFRDQRTALEKQGALFTIQALEEAAQHYLKQPSTPEIQRYLKQLHSDIDLLLQTWQRDQLTNKEARDTLDNRAVQQLMSEQKSLSAALQKPVTDYIQAQKQKRFDDWQARRCDEKLHPDLEPYLSRELYKAWNGQPDEKHPLHADIKRHQHALLHEAFRQKTLAAPTMAKYCDRMRNEFSNTVTMNPTTDPNFPNTIIPILKSALDREIEQCYDKEGIKSPTDRGQKFNSIKEKAVNNVMAYWQAGTLDKAVAEALYKLSAHRIDVGALVTENERKPIFLNAIVGVLADYRLNNPLLKTEQTKALAQAVKPIFLNPDIDEQQWREGFIYLLTEWKAGRLSQENETALTTLLTREWKALQQKMQQQFDPMLRLAALEAMVQRLMQSPAVDEKHPQQEFRERVPAEAWQPPAVAAAASCAPMSQLLSGIGIHAPLPIIPSQPLEGTPASHPSEEGQPQPGAPTQVRH